MTNDLNIFSSVIYLSTPPAISAVVTAVKVVPEFVISTPILLNKEIKPPAFNIYILWILSYILLSSAPIDDDLTYNELSFKKSY